MGNVKILLRHIIIKLSWNTGQNWILKAKKNNFWCKRQVLWVYQSVSKQKPSRKTTWDKIFKVLKEQKLSTNNTVSGKMSFSNEEMKAFSGEKAWEFLTIRSALQKNKNKKMLKKVFLAKRILNNTKPYENIKFSVKCKYTNIEISSKAMMKHKSLFLQWN